MKFSYYNLDKDKHKELSNYKKKKLFTISFNHILEEIQFENSDDSFYDSWSPKNEFEKAYREVEGMDFGWVIRALKVGFAVRRKGWNGKFVVKQVPSHITGDIIPNMQSLPQSAKNILMSRENPHIDYTNQMLIVDSDGKADSWIPSPSDIFAEDWEIITK